MNGKMNYLKVEKETMAICLRVGMSQKLTYSL